MITSHIFFDPATSGAAHSLLGSNPHRRSLTLFAPASGGVTFSNEPAPTYNQGIVMIPGQAPITMTIESHGDLIQREWYVVYSGVFSPVTWVEGIV